MKRALLLSVFGLATWAGVMAVALAVRAAAAPGEKQEQKEGEEGHKGEKRDLGKQQIGGHTVQVTQVGDVKPGTEAIFVLTVSGGAGKPKAIRGWVGVESGERSIKSKAEDEEKEYHLHHQVSKPLPANSKLWIEVETSAGRKKSAFQPKL